MKLVPKGMTFNDQPIPNRNDGNEVQLDSILECTLKVQRVFIAI